MTDRTMRKLVFGSAGICLTYIGFLFVNQGTDYDKLYGLEMFGFGFFCAYQFFKLINIIKDDEVET